MKGNLFNIQKFSIHDGPGIRTTVFFKGCPLRCKWCANPESQSGKVQITYDKRTCSGCLSCVDACPNQCISYRKEQPQSAHGTIAINDSACAGCLSCVNACPTYSLKAEGEWMDIGKVADICLQDLDFYEESGGGVTLSGGECMCQPRFAEALVKALKEHRIHVAAETTGYIKRDIFQKLAPMFDLLLFDVKHYDPGLHAAGTGASNERIVENLTWAFEQGLHILPRIPVIPGFNAALKDAGGIADLLFGIGLRTAQLLPFHQLGERKYELLHRDYSFQNVPALYPENLKEYQQIFLDRGIDCFI